MDHNLAALGTPNRYGEYIGFECPRCGEHRTHATPAVGLWRCWGCDVWGKLVELAALPRRPENAPAGAKPELPRRRTVSLEVVER